MLPDLINAVFTVLQFDCHIVLHNGVLTHLMDPLGKCIALDITIFVIFFHGICFL